MPFLFQSLLLPEIKKASDGLITCMQEAANFSVPLNVEVGVGFNWDQAH